MASSLFLGAPVASPSAFSVSSSSSNNSCFPQQYKNSAPPSLLVVRASSSSSSSSSSSQTVRSRRDAMKLAVAIVAGTALAAGSARAGLVEELLEKSAANKELNDRKRLATSGANLARAWTVTFGTCKFPENFTGCQDLAKIKNVPFLSDDLKLECEGKDKYKCGSNVFWKW